ncbi:HNH endonuclease signature motif containing protein [Agrobacterium tumefaciens]|uniref:HNH endonuclease signature motif containing protein n=1 Tax=Agrobacterium tumefaciens TaxID=358 RepID=UPI003BA2FC51
MNEGQIIELFIRAAEVDRKVSKTAPRNDIPYSRVRSVLLCDAEAGKLYWKKRPIKLFKDGCAFDSWNKKFAGREAFTAQDENGYFCGGIFGKRYRAHRIIWLLHYKKWPSQVIDHINGNPGDNRIVNLRDVSQAENIRNSPSSRAADFGKVRA